MTHRSWFKVRRLQSFASKAPSEHISLGRSHWEFFDGKAPNTILLKSSSNLRAFLDTYCLGKERCKTTITFKPWIRTGWTTEVCWQGTPEPISSASIWHPWLSISTTGLTSGRQNLFSSPKENGQNKKQQHCMHLQCHQGTSFFDASHHLVAMHLLCTSGRLTMLAWMCCLHVLARSPTCSFRTNACTKFFFASAV